MEKPKLLRAALVAANAWLREDPDRLRMFVDRGHVVATSTPSPSFTYVYRLNIRLLDYTGDQDAITVPLLFWLREQQPDLFADPERAKTAVAFDVDIIDAGTVDIGIEFELRENVSVARLDNGNWSIVHLAEPQWGANGYEPPAAGVLKIFTWGEDVLIDASDG